MKDQQLYLVSKRRRLQLVKLLQISESLISLRREKSRLGISDPPLVREAAKPGRVHVVCKEPGPIMRRGCAYISFVDCVHAVKA